MQRARAGWCEVEEEGDRLGLSASSQSLEVELLVELRKLDVPGEFPYD